MPSVPFATVQANNGHLLDSPEVIVADNLSELKLALQKYIGDLIVKALLIPGHVSIGLSGGSMPKILGDILPKLPVNWKRIKFFMVDERVVPHNHGDSNYGQWRLVLPEQIHPSLVPVELQEIVYKERNDATVYDISRTALNYEIVLKQQVGPEIIGRLPRFDLILLGIGPDGHTASLFPNSKLWKLSDNYSWLLGVDDSPKPPSKRVTISLPVINHAKNVAFVITGEQKSNVVKGILERDPLYPASAVRPTIGKLKFFLDSAAASRLTEEETIKASDFILAETPTNDLPKFASISPRIKPEEEKKMDES